MMNKDKPSTNASDAAEKLIRQRIDALYGDETKGTVEAKQGSIVDKFWHRHDSHPNPHAAWRDYYETLSEKDRHKLWEQYHLQVDGLSGVPQIGASETRPSVEEEKHFEPKPVTRKEKAERKRRLKAEKEESRSFMHNFFKNHVWPIISAALVVVSVWLVFNNELVIAKVTQYISPGNSDLTPAIIDPSVEVGSAPKLIIPKINVEVPVVYSVATREESKIQEALKKGVVHYAGTGLPGEIGNNVIVGHSSNNYFNDGKYKFVFVLLNRLQVGDTFILEYEGTRYVYKVFNRQIVEPNDFSLTLPSTKPIVSLIGCDPPGTSWRRLVVQGEQISPDPSSAKTVERELLQPDNLQIVPGNPTSLWENFWGWVF